MNWEARITNVQNVKMLQNVSKVGEGGWYEKYVKILGLGPTGTGGM